MPVVRVGHSNNAGLTSGTEFFIGGGNLTTTKARLLLPPPSSSAALPLPADEGAPSRAERDTIAAKVARCQAIYSNL